MNANGQVWALVLAAGAGSRLQSLTTTAAGIAVPKQFCSLRGGPSLLDEALERARAVTTPQRTCVVVAAQHSRWWKHSLERFPANNIIVQPQNRGTANGILLPLLHIQQRDPDASVLLLPSDHHVSDEGTLRQSLREAVGQLQSRGSSIVLLGLEPEEVDPELGYIVPGLRDGHVQHVEQFVEKPSLELASRLLEQGAMWNAFIVAARVHSLIELFTVRYPQLVADMRSVVTADKDHPMDPQTTAALYERIPDLDFSREILQAFPQALRVLSVPACGWSDLGTPARVARTLSRTSARERDFDRVLTFHQALNLAEQHSLRQVHG